MRYDKMRTGYVRSSQLGKTVLACESRCVGGGKSTPAADENFRSSAFLINGPRLEINLSHRKRSTLRISNQRYRAALKSQKSSAPASRRSPFTTEASDARTGSQSLRILIANADPSRIGILSDHRESKGVSSRFLIANARLELNLSHRKHSIVEISNRKWMPVFEFQKPLLIGLPNA
jgi:hypothetical protein